MVSYLKIEPQPTLYMITAEITEAITVLLAGGLVAFPTETVYGLGADASNEEAVSKIFTAKGRPAHHPLIVHIGHLDELNLWAQDIPMSAFKLAAAFWPGPLTLILKKQPHVLNAITGNQPTIGMRMPRHPIAQALLKAFGKGIAAPSANRFTHLSPTSAAAVKEELGNKVDMILDGGDCEVGLESTIIDMSGMQPVILRPGMVNRDALERVLETEILTPENSHTKTQAPGMHHLHYAPQTKTRLMKHEQLVTYLHKPKANELPLGLIIHCSLPAELLKADKIYPIKLSTDPTRYAHDLYQSLRELDHQQLKQIVIETVPETAEWEAIRDRLQKASAG